MTSHSSITEPNGHRTRVATSEQSISASTLRYLARHSEQTNSIRIKKLKHNSKEPPAASEDTRNSSLTSDIRIPKYKLLVF